MMNVFTKVKLTDVVGALFDLILIFVRPVAFMLIWNYGVANDTIPKLALLQIIAIILIFNILITYIPFHLLKKD